MSSEWELDEGIRSIKSAWRREHTARSNLEKMLEQAEADNAKLRLMVWIMRECLADECKHCSEHGFPCDIDHDIQELGIRICDLAAEDELGIEVE